MSEKQWQEIGIDEVVNKHKGTVSNYIIHGRNIDSLSHEELQCVLVDMIEGLPSRDEEVKKK